MYTDSEKHIARSLRTAGKTYAEISDHLGRRVPKTTLSGWCHGVSLSPKAQQRIQARTLLSLRKARLAAVEKMKQRAVETRAALEKENEHLLEAVPRETAKFALILLYWAEGSKYRDIVCFGNSDPSLIRLFLKLLKICYPVSESKLRCTVQCRADQDIEKLVSFWSVQTNLDRKQFYKTRVDRRTEGKPTKKQGYYGVCVIEYLSSHAQKDLLAGITVLQKHEGR